MRKIYTHVRNPDFIRRKTFKIVHVNGHETNT